MALGDIVCGEVMFDFKSKNKQRRGFRRRDMFDVESEERD